MSEGLKMNDTVITCASNLLWFMSQRTDERGIINVSDDDIMREFNVDHGTAKELIGEISNPIALKFIEILGNNQYRLTEAGVDEVAFLQCFVRVAANRKVNPRNAVKISVCLREWLKGRDAQTVSEEEAQILIRLKKPNTAWTEEEIESAWRMYQNNAKVGF